MSEFPDIKHLHDCETCAAEYSGNTLNFIFKKEKVSDALKANNADLMPYHKLKVNYILSADFEDDQYCPAVKHVNHHSFFRKNAVQLWTLKKFVDNLHRKGLNLMFYDHYFNGHNCIIFAESVKGLDWQTGNWFEIELLVDEIIYAWIE